jgi:sugar lactone lactonase YvrE
MAAWNRPDQFHRVLSFIGTYVAMKGADSLPALIRKTEPKPIRIHLQAGKNDHIVPTQPYGTFYAGSWPINNQVMFEAFESAGYDAKLVIGDEGHNMKQGAAIMPDALRWLWRGYPDPIVVKEPAGMSREGWDPRGKVYSTVSADKPWEPVGETYRSVASPAPDKDGNVFFADPASNRIYKSDPDGKVTLFKDNASGASALAAGPDGRLYASQPTRKRIVSYGAAGDEKVVAQNTEATAIAITAKAAIYFTDAVHKTVGFIDAAGKTRIVYSGGEIALPTGLTLSPDQAMLLVTDAQGRHSWSFQIALDGSLTNGEPFYRLEMPEAGWMSDVTGVTEDSIGQVYFATAVGIQVCEANGRVAQILNPPERGRITSIAFGGRDLNWLYAAEGGKLFRRPVKVKGVAAWAPEKPPKPPL